MFYYSFKNVILCHLEFFYFLYIFKILTTICDSDWISFQFSVFSVCYLLSVLQITVNYDKY